MKPRKEGETDANYIARLESRNDGLHRRNNELSAWANDINQAVTALACEASLVFQAMAEKARVRSHPSVTKAVEMFDSISHPQWTKGVKKFPIEEWPTDWDFDPPSAQSGDADMQLNAPIATAIDYLEGRKFNCSAKEWEHVSQIIADLHAATQSRVDGIKEVAGFQVRHKIKGAQKHPKEMNREELLSLVTDMGWMALDLAQDMSATNEMLRRDLRASAYRRIQSDLYTLAYLEWERPEPRNIDVKVIGDEAPF